MFFIVDIETDGLNEETAKILEIGFCGENLEWESWIINPGKFNEKAWIFQNSDLTPELIREKGVKWEDIKDKVQEYFNGPVTAFNNQFDFKFLRKAGITITHPHIFDPMKEGQKMRITGTKWPKVTECIDYFKLDVVEPHRAGRDAWIEMMLIQEMQKKGYCQLTAKDLIRNEFDKKLRYLSKIESYENLMKEFNHLKGTCSVLQKIDEKLTWMKKRV